MSGRLPWVVGGSVAAVAVAGGAVTVALTSGSDPTSVQEVADRAVAAASELDVDAGVDLLCAAPSATDRAFLLSAIHEGRARTGTSRPQVDYEVGQVAGTTSGSFVVTITSPEAGLAGVVGRVRVIVRSKGGRSCIASTVDGSIDPGPDHFVVR